LVVALVSELRKAPMMISARFAVFFILPTALAAINPAFASEARTPYVRPVSEITKRVYFTPATPLDEIPLYSLDSASPEALRGLEAEVARLYSHSTSLPSGPDRRAFQTRIYNLEKRLRPLEKQFNAELWTELRSAVRLEWEAVQGSLPRTQTITPVANATQTAAKNERS
jgi:hypothetical protein